MAVDATKVRVAITGAVSKGLTSATAPTGTASSLTGFTDVGGISEDGVTLSLPDNGDSTPIKVWQNGATVRTVRATSDDLPQLSFTMVETSLTAVETYFGVTVTQTVTEGSFEFVVENRTADSYVLDVIDGTELIRVYVPNGVVASVGEINLTNTDAIGYQVTLDLDLDATKGYNFKTWMTALLDPA
jgi:hypothetical protein